RLSGPLLDRIDLHVPVRALGVAEILTSEAGESSATVRARVEQARVARAKRANGAAPRTSGRLSPECRRLLEAAHARLGLSARAHARIVRVARTIADLAAAAVITPDHLAEAVQYRALDRESSDPGP
ncbi:MAG: hypothetical protein ABR559_01540, partial [Gemmatimonadota bacterium]